MPITRKDVLNHVKSISGERILPTRYFIPNGEKITLDGKKIKDWSECTQEEYSNYINEWRQKQRND